MPTLRLPRDLLAGGVAGGVDEAVKRLELKRPDGAELVAAVAGAAPIDLVLVHGYPFDHSQWDPQLGALTDVARIVAPDLRGLGASGLPASGRATMADHADDIAAWMDEVGVERAVLGGLSMGGYVAFETWRRHRDRITALVLADTRAEADPPAVKEARVQAREAIRARGMGVVYDGMLEKVLGETTRRSRPDVVAKVRSLILGTDPAGAMAALDAMRERPDSTRDLAGIDVPVLVVVGAEDALTPPDVARALAGTLGAELAEIRGAGHVSSLEAPDAVSAALRRFLESIA